MGLEFGGGGGVWARPAAAVAVLQWKGLTQDSKVNPDVLLLLISLADEWEGKITGASQGGPVCCPATQALPQLTSEAPAAAADRGVRPVSGGEAVHEPPRGYGVSESQGEAGIRTGSHCHRSAVRRWAEQWATRDVMLYTNFIKMFDF